MRQHTFREMKQFSIVLKATRGLFRFCFTSLCDWSRKLAPLNQTISAKLKPFTTPSAAFSRALRGLLVFTLSCHWLFKAFFVLLIGYFHFFGFGSMTLIEITLCEARG